MKKVISLVTTVSLLGCSFAVAAPKESDLKNQLNKNNASVEAKQAEIQKVQNKKRGLLDEIEDLDMEMSETQKEIDSIQGEINTLNSQIKNREKKISDANKKREEEEKLLQKRVRAMYENGNTAYLSLLLNSENITDFIKRCELAERMIESDKKLFDDLENLKKDTETEITALEGDKVVVEAAKRQETASRDKLATSRSAKKSRVNLLQGDINEMQKQLDRIVEESEKIERQLRELSGVSTVVSKNEKFIWPAAYSKSITCKYGPRIHPITKKRSVHTGIDVRATMNSNVYAAASGKVVKACWNKAYGNMIIIDHGNGLSTLYAHANKLCVKVGDTVSQGDIIMKAGSTGYSTGPHLHFEVRKNGKPQDPKNYLDFSGVKYV